MPQQFTWRPRVESPANSSFRILKAQYGDGYGASAGDGINTKVRRLDLTFVGIVGKIQAIRDFLDEHEGSKSFYFTPALGNQGLFVAEEYVTSKIGQNVYNLSVTFQEKFRP